MRGSRALDGCAKWDTFEVGRCIADGAVQRVRRCLAAGLGESAVHDEESKLIYAQREAVKELHVEDPTIEFMQKASNDLKSCDMVEERLLMRHGVSTSICVVMHLFILVKFLSELKLGHVATTWLHHVLTQIESLRFAQDWRNVTGPGSLKRKTTFYKAAYALTLGDLTDELSQIEMEHLVTNQYLRAYKRWRREVMEPIVTGRNRLLSLYDNVSLLFVNMSIVATINAGIQVWRRFADEYYVERGLPGQAVL